MRSLIALSKCMPSNTSFQVRRKYGKSSRGSFPEFGILFDIDGVLVRGKRVFPFCPAVFKRLTNQDGKFIVPTVFLTNAGNLLRSQKAEQLSSWLGVEVEEDQVVMAHSPLKMFRQFHDKHVLISGQGPMIDIAKNIGFNNTSTVADLCKAYPMLDAVDCSQRNAMMFAQDSYYPPIDAIVLFGEPVRWETSLQLILDLLLTDGQPSEGVSEVPFPHIPILACNMDLQWMAEASMPRFGHGAFLVCLESLYKKITGKDLIYTALIGKPSEITYHHAEKILIQQSAKLNLPSPVSRIYAIGDNINTDIFGANLYNRYLSRHKGLIRHSLLRDVRGSDVTFDDDMDIEYNAESCCSILVQTGVYTEGEEFCSNHSPRDFLPVEKKLCEPTYIVENVLCAIDLIFNIEGIK